jgi:non-homologous end joining protein Ku
MAARNMFRAYVLVHRPHQHEVDLYWEFKKNSDDLDLSESPLQVHRILTTDLDLSVFHDGYKERI